MAKFRRAQVSFTCGELSPKLRARRDTNMFYLGCEKLTNVIVHPEGMASVRPGTLQISQPFDDATRPGMRLIPFVFNEAQKYLVVLFHLAVWIYRWPDNALVGAIVTPWQYSDLAELDWLQVRDTLIVCHQSYAPRMIQRQTDGSFTLGLYSFDRPPQHRYQPGTVRMQANATTGSGVGISCLDGPGFFPASVGDIWVFQGGAVKLTTVDPSKESAIGTVVAGSIKDTTASADWTEQAHSVLRGYYRAVAYYQDRLWLGGTKTAPTQLWGSRVASPYDFLTGGVNDGDPVKLPASSGRADPIRYLMPGAGGLEVYTSGEEAIIPGGVDQPITPKSIAYVPQTSFGCRLVKPIRMESATHWAQRDGGAIRQMVYSDVQQAYQALTLTVRAAHLTSDPVRMTAAPGAFGLQTSFVLIVNRNGTGAIMTSESSQEVTAWTEWTSRRKLLDACAVGDRVYVATSSGGRHFVEYMHPDAIYDAQRGISLATASDTITGLADLASSKVDVHADGYWIGVFTVDAAGKLKLPSPHKVYNIGLTIDWLVRPMPVDSEQASMLGQRIRPVVAYLRLDSSMGVRVNGRVIYDRPIKDAIVVGPQKQTDVRRVTLQGWSNGNRAPVQITRDGPFPVQLLALAVDYRVGDR